MDTHPQDYGRFAPDELAVVLSHYDLGIVESVTEFRRGSRRSPKVGVVCERGKFLLKKRDAVRGGVDRVRYSHAIQAHLASRDFPLPRLLAPRDSADTVLNVGGCLYELFDYVSGHAYTGEGDETRDAGRVLARFHLAMEGFAGEEQCRRGGYHDATAVQTGLNALPGKIAAHESAAGQDAEILGLATFLFDAYIRAGEVVDELGHADWPDHITHCDWHPGNLLYKRGRVLAVIDYDCARLGKRAADLANGLLQFSLIGGNDPSDWPDEPDLVRAREFLGGYLEGLAPSGPELQALPSLMVEALIAEAVLPVVATGSFGPYPGFGFLRMVRRKVAWLLSHLSELQSLPVGQPALPPSASPA